MTPSDVVLHPYMFFAFPERQNKLGGNAKNTYGLEELCYWIIKKPYVRRTDAL